MQVEDKTNSVKWLNSQYDRFLAWELFQMELLRLFDPDNRNSNGLDDDEICDKVGFSEKYFIYKLLFPTIRKVSKIHEQKL